MLGGFIDIALLLFFAFFMVLFLMIPVFVARRRGIDGSDLTVIKVLAAFGIFFGITWLVALIFSLAWERGGDLNRLEKLQSLRESGAVSQEEFNAAKKKILG